MAKKKDDGLKKELEKEINEIESEIESNINAIGEVKVAEPYYKKEG